MKRLPFAVAAIFLALCVAAAATGLPPPLQHPFFPKSRAAAAAAEKGNLVINPVSSAATIASPGSAPSTTGFTNIMPVASGFAASFTATATPGSNVLTGVAFSGGLALASYNPGMFLIGSHSNATLSADIAPGAAFVSYNSGASTITMSKPAPSTATGSSVTIYVATDRVDYLGGVPASYGANLTVSGTTVTSASPAYGYSGYAVEFWTDVANVTTGATGLSFTLYQNGVTPNSYRVAIDDVYQTAAPTLFTNAGTNYLTIQFTNAGMHKVRIELPAGYILQQLWVYNPASIWKGTNGSEVRIGAFGDSWFLGGEAGSWPGRNIPNTLAQLMGWKCDLLSVGGTGYVYNGGANFAWTSTYRSINDVARRVYDALVFFGSVNDNAAADATLTAAALLTWQQARLANPTAPIIVFGVPVTALVNATNAARMEADLLAAFTAWGDSNSYWVPVTSDLDGAWLNTSNAAWATNGYIAQTIVNATTAASTLFTVNSMTSGPPIEVGMLVAGTNLSGQTIAAFGTGTGGAGTYTLSGAASGASTGSYTIGDGNHASDGVGTLYLAQRMAAKVKAILAAAPSI